MSTVPAALDPTAPQSRLTAKADQEAARERFEGAFGVVRNELFAHFAAHGLPADAVEWYSRVLDYNVLGGKLNRGVTVIDTVQGLKGNPLTDDEYFKASVLGWAIEFLQSFFLVADDVMDSSITRRGRPCWYRQPGVGTTAINDALLLEGAIYRLLRTHFKGTPYYAELLDLFHDLVDLITAPEDRIDLSKFSLERHSLIVIYKTAFYSFYLPVALAMLMCRIPSDPSEPSDPYKLSLEILLPLGEYFQIQDDYLDFAGTPEQIGKVGTDIIDNKCSWCINTALSVATPSQRAVLDANYGRKDSACESRVKAIFEEVGIRERYENYEKDAYERISVLIDEMPEVQSAGGNAVLRREVFRMFLEKIHKRQK